ncbi:Protein of unknown function [Pyronema omphalodes CBS 100304]|uniref:Uncharacterized protein n=1 Tax=Pyronema omphalodes (strain CBS 100304) TaxID=1076935 RepID=U4LTV0_PYROM|nr:Protein of unknown function [Pyronema omphalodes CBS 100304]
MKAEEIKLSSQRLGGRGNKV